MFKKNFKKIKIKRKFATKKNLKNSINSAVNRQSVSTYEMCFSLIFTVEFVNL